MSDTKWADVAHYYLKSGINVTWKTIFDRREFMSEIGTMSLDSLTTMPDSKPILCHRDDITEAQAREICEPMIESLKEVEGDSFEPPKSYKAFLFRPITHKGTWSLLDHALGNPRDWHKFIQWGIDVFGLIESGQAIRKEAGNDQ